MKSLMYICVIVFLGLSVRRCICDKVIDNVGMSSSERDDEPLQVKSQQDKADESESSDVDDNEEDGDLEANKRAHYGSILGKGFSFGKRFGSILGKGYSFGKRYGYVLGKGYGFGKRYSNGYENSMPARSRWLDDYNWDDDGIRYDGIKRDVDNIGEDFEFVDLDGPLDEKRSESEDEDDLEYNKRSKRDIRKRRFIQYYGNLMGRGFTVGRRASEDMGGDNDESRLINPYEEFDGDEENPGVQKRLYSSILGRGYMFGKRRPTSNRRNLFGNLLGRGFAFGKRSDDSDQLGYEDTMSAGEMEGRSQLDDDEMSALNDNPSKRYVMSSPGNRFKFGKRFGFILGKGFSFGKRGFLTPPQRKRPFGFVLGRGFSFGKRSPEVINEVPGMDNHFTPEQIQYNQELENNEKRAGYLLGNGYLFGKRGHKRFGYLLGNGFSMGKRGDEEDEYMDNGYDDASIFVDEEGNMYVFTGDLEEPTVGPTELSDDQERVIVCDGEVVPYYSESSSDFLKRYEMYMSQATSRSNPDVPQYFTDGFGNEFVRVDGNSGNNFPFIGKDVGVTYYGCAGNVQELVDDLETVDDMSKRNFNEKRGYSWKRFGHILGRGFSFGK